MGDYTIAFVLIIAIGLILLFVFLKMHEYLKNINDNLTETNRLLRQITDKDKK